MPSTFEPPHIIVIVLDDQYDHSPIEGDLPANVAVLRSIFCSDHEISFSLCWAIGIITRYANRSWPAWQYEKWKAEAVATPGLGIGQSQESSQLYSETSARALYVDPSPRNWFMLLTYMRIPSHSPLAALYATLFSL